MLRSILLSMGIGILLLGACDPQVQIADPGQYEVVALIAE